MMEADIEMMAEEEEVHNKFRYKSPTFNTCNL